MTDRDDLRQERDDLRQQRDDLRAAADAERASADHARSVRDDLLNAGISPRERLQRIETLLEGVDRKLDGKADAAHVAALEQRIRLLEVGGGDRVVEVRARQDQTDVRFSIVERKLAYATGTLATVTVLVNAVTVWLISH